MNKALISGYFGFGNIGDETIKIVLRKELSSLNVYPQFLVKEVKEAGEIKRDNLWDIIRGVVTSNFVISGGGGLLQDRTSSRSLYYYLSILILAKIFKKKAFIIGQGIGPINRNINRILTKITLNKCDLISVRDGASKKLLEEIGVKKEIFVTQDLSFLYEIEFLKNDLSHTQYNILQVKGRENIDIEEMADIARLMHDKTKEEIVILPFFRDVDEPFAREIEKRTGFKVLVKDNVDEVLTIMNSAHIIVGMRYHSLLFSILLQKPVLPIFYDNKMRNLSKFFELDGIDIDKLNLPNFSKAFDTLLKNEEEIKKRIKDKLPIAKAYARKNFDLIIKYIS